MEDNLEKLESLCTEQGTHKGLAQKFCAMSDGFTYEFFCDEKRKSWLVTDRSGNKEERFYLPFGYEVERIINLFMSFNPKSPLYKENQDLLEAGKITNDDVEVIQNIYKDMSLPIADFLTFVHYFDTMREEGKQGKIDLWNLWHTYRYMNYTELFPLVYGYTRTNIFEYANTLVHNKVSSGVFTDYVLYDDGNDVTGGYVYKTHDMEYLFCLDLFQVLIVGSAGKCNVCKRCGRIYFSASGKSVYCQKCRKESNKIRNENRKNNESRYLHKRILDKLLYLYDKDSCEYMEFKEESNYYWAIVQNKKPEKIKKYSTKIKTESDYIEWLKKKLEELKVQK